MKNIRSIILFLACGSVVASGYIGTQFFRGLACGLLLSGAILLVYAYVQDKQMKESKSLNS